MALRAYTQWLDFLRGLLLGFVPVWPFMLRDERKRASGNCINCACERVCVGVVRIGWEQGRGAGGGFAGRRLRIKDLELQSEGRGERRRRREGVGASPFVGFSSAAPAIPLALFCRVLPVGCSCGLPPCALHPNELRAARSRGEGAPWSGGHNCAPQTHTSNLIVMLLKPQSLVKPKFQLLDCLLNCQ